MKLKLLFTVLAFSIVSTITSAEAPQPWEVVGFRATKNLLDPNYTVRLALKNPITKKQGGYVDLKAILDNGLSLNFTIGGYKGRQIINEETELRLAIGHFDCLFTTEAIRALKRLERNPPITKWGIQPPDDSCVVS